MAQLYADPRNRGVMQERKAQSVGFNLENKGPKLRAQGAARQLIEESRSIFINNLTNLVNSVAIAHQFFQKADEDHDGTVTRAQLRKWVRSMLAADAYAGLDREAQVADVCSQALGSTPDFERSIGSLLDRAVRRQGVGTVREGDGPLLGTPPESWVQKGRNLDADSDATDSETSEPPSNSADSTGTLTPTSNSSSEDEGTAARRAHRVDPHTPVAFETFKKAVDALSLKTLLRTDGVRHEIPVSEEPPAERIPVLVAQREECLTLWDQDISELRSFSRSKACKAWEDAYASGKNCIWVVPEPDHDVQRVLAEGWFETKGICLELGCGLGYDSVAFAQAGFDVIGVDISATAICAARAMARAKGVQDHVQFMCGDAYELPRPTKPAALIWDNTLYQNAQRGDRYGSKWKYNSARYKELLLKLTVPGSLVMMNVMSSELTEGHIKLAERGFSLPLTSAMRVAMEFVEFFEFIFFRNGIYDMNALFIREASEIGYAKPAQIGGLPSWCVLMRRREVPKPYAPDLPEEEPFVAASRLLARDGFRRPPPPRFLQRLVEEEWGERWGEGPASGLALAPGQGDEEDATAGEAPPTRGEALAALTAVAGSRSVEAEGMGSGVGDDRQDWEGVD